MALRKTFLLPIVLALLVSASPLHADDNPSPAVAEVELQDLRQEVEDAARAYADGRLDGLATRVEERVAGGGFEATALLLQAWFYRANILRYRRTIQEHPDGGEFKDVQVALADKGEELARSTLEEHPDSILVQVLLGEFIALQITGPNGALIGPRAAEVLDKALEVEPENVDAHLAAGRRYLYTPGAFGGSDSKALEHLQKAEKVLNAKERGLIKSRREEELAGVSDAAEKKTIVRALVQRTRTEVWRLHEEVLIQLSVVYRRMDRDRRARVALQRALAANPESECAQLLLARLEASEDQ